MRNDSNTLAPVRSYPAVWPIFLSVSLSLPYIACAEPTVDEPDAASPDAAVGSSSSGDDATVAGLTVEQAESPTRITLAQELSYKLEQPDYLVKNRASAQLEYSKYFLDHFFAQLNVKTTAFLGGDHRHDAEGFDTQLSQAFVQTSFRGTSVRAGVQTLPWGESILAPITDEVSPRDNRELFNFNLEELRIGQPMLTVDQYSPLGRWSVFFTPEASFNKRPEVGSAYYFDPFTYQAGSEGADGKHEYGASWKKNFASADITLMAASLIDNDYALRRADTGLIVREKQRLSLVGMSFNYAIKSFVVRGEIGLKSPKAFNDAAMQIVKRDTVDAYLAVEYAPSTSVTMSLEAVNQHIRDWDSTVQTPRDRQSLLLNVTQKFLHDDLSINLMSFYNTPDSSVLGILSTTYKWNDNVTFGFNVVYPYTREERSGLWAVRDQKQTVFRAQYQF